MFFKKIILLFQFLIIIKSIKRKFSPKTLTFQGKLELSFPINENPIIGVLTQPSSWVNIYDPKEYSYIAASYVKALESAGARIVPIKYDEEEKELENILEGINGLFLPGGGSDILDETGEALTKFGENAIKLVNLAEKINKKGEYFPIWGTCLGYEILLMAFSGNISILESYNSSSHNGKLDFLGVAKTSRLFRTMPEEWKSLLKKDSIVYFNHKYGLSSIKYHANKILKRKLKPLTISKDKNNSSFFSTVEGRKFPIYGTQFHPEKNSFEWKEHLEIDHSPLSIQIMRHFLDFFVNEARKNNRKYTNKQDEHRYLIYNYYPIQLSESFQSIYIFSKPNNAELFRAIPIKPN